MTALNARTAFDLTGRVAIVTGAGGGIGEGIATALAQAGAHVVAADLAKDQADEVAARLTAAGLSAESAALDVSDKAAVEDLVDAMVASHGRLDIMANNAGIMVNRPALDITEEEFDRVIDVNLKGVLFGCQAAGRVMGEGGSIINTASTIIDMAAPGNVGYGAAKMGVSHLTWTFAKELGERGIRVNTVVPGWVESGITRRNFTATDGSIDEAAREQLVARNSKGSPLGRVGEPSDLGLACVYLAGDAARVVTGQTLRINAGVTMR